MFEALPVAAKPESRRRALDNLWVIVTAGAALLIFATSLVYFARRTTEVSPLVSDVVLYTLYGVDLAILAALFFVLGRNLLKLWVEQAPFAKFRARLVAALLLLTVIPSGLVLISGSEIIRTSFDRWLSPQAEAVLDAAKNLAQQYYEERLGSTERSAVQLARAATTAVGDGNVVALSALLKTEIGRLPPGAVDIYQATRAPVGDPDADFLVGGRSPQLPAGTERERASADRLAARAIASGRNEPAPYELTDGAMLVRTAVPVRTPEGVTVGAIVVAEYVDPKLAAEARNATNAYEQYQQIKFQRGPLQFVYLGIFLMVALLILISATWFGLYMAKRITRPVQMLAEGARAIGAGQLDLRIEPETTDEMGSLIESFNTMAAELRTSQEKLEHSRHDLETKNVEVEGRRRYIETILERVATGVIALDADGAISTVNRAAERLLGLDATAIGQPARVVLARERLRPLLPLADVTRRPETAGVVQEVTLANVDREVHLAVAATVLTGEGGRVEGAVLVLDDVTPLIRAQRVAAWRDVARRLAHEIKNPLTPIQLSAERLRRNFQTAAPPAKSLVEECTGAIITEVEALKGLVDEFAQFARMRGPRTVPSDLNRLIEDTLRLYSGLLQQSQLKLQPDLMRDLPTVRIDSEQIRQVIINLVDNAVEALGGPAAGARPDGKPPTIVVATTYDKRNSVVRVAVSDNGPGVPAADRDKLFMPYFSTKGRGSGLGLAIVRRIVAEHGGGIEVGDARPGTVFTVELPAA